MKLQTLLERLGIDPDLVASRNLPAFGEAQQLVVADVSQSGREHRLVPVAARAWRGMKEGARADGVSLIIVSAFRSIEQQVDLFRSQLDQGCSLESILLSSAPPGYSEHHTGRAIDIGTAGCAPVSADFEGTPAYAWLAENAKAYGFRLSYPRDNFFGFCFEPWHWYYDGGA